MSQFKVHVQYIVYGCCGIELLIGNKLIKCDAGYGGPNPLASLIEACLDFSIAKKEGYESETPKEYSSVHQSHAVNYCYPNRSDQLIGYVFGSSVIIVMMNSNCDQEAVLS